MTAKSRQSVTQENQSAGRRPCIPRTLRSFRQFIRAAFLLHRFANCRGGCAREQKQWRRPALSVPEPILGRVSPGEGAVPPGSLPCGGLLRSILCGEIRLDLGLGFLSTHALIHVVLDGLLEHRGLGLLGGLGG